MRHAEFCITTLNRNLIIGSFQSQEEIFLDHLHFEPLDLRYEMIVMPLEWVFGCDGSCVFHLVVKIYSDKKVTSKRKEHMVCSYHAPHTS